MKLHRTPFAYRSDSGLCAPAEQGLTSWLSPRSFVALAFTILLLGGGGAARSQPPADLTLVDLGHSFSSVLAIRNAGDGSGRLFMVQRSGTIVIVDAGGNLLSPPFLDIASDVDTFFEGGLLGLAFHPDYANNGYFYVYYTRDGSPLETVVERFTVSAGDPNDADESSREEIFTLPQPAGNHNGGDIHFGPDGYLYIGLGDGGSSSSTSQNLGNLLGKMLRIDPCDTAVCAQPYTIPPSNPFVGTATLDEIWGIGFRNPYRWSFDRQTGDLLIADVGAGAREEVSFEAAGISGGLNYGWNCREGDIAGPGGCSGTFVEPVVTYSHSASRCSITGGFRYRGCIQGLVGTYVYADYCTAEVFMADETAPGSWTISQNPWMNLPGNVFGFGEGEDGELYISQGGSVARFESATDCLPGAIFTDGFESGDVSSWTSSTP
jgi:hypothetical protein